jgi:hypothetical protein
MLALRPWDAVVTQRHDDVWTHVGRSSEDLNLYIASMYLVGAAVLQLKPCGQLVIMLADLDRSRWGTESEQIEPWAEECGKMQSRPVMPGGSRV